MRPGRRNTDSKRETLAPAAGPAKQHERVQPTAGERAEELELTVEELEERVAPATDVFVRIGGVPGGSEIK